MGNRKKTIKKLLILRVDEIGDYMLWHKFLKEVIQSDKFIDFEIHFCGNRIWKTLFETFDSDRISHSFWIDKSRFKKEIGYRFQFLKMIYREGYNTVINPSFSRDKRNDDSIVRAAKAPVNFGMIANLESIRDYEQGYDQGLYSNLFHFKETPIFEFYRNRLFAEFITQKKSAVINTKINTDLLPKLTVQLPEKYFVIFPGSRSQKRIWPVENFLLVAQYLSQHQGWIAVVAGSNADEKYTGPFVSRYKEPYLNLTGKTSLTEMMKVLQNAQCLISVDTGSVHLAAAVGCPVFGIFNGSQYRRFAPYPADIAANFHAVYPDDVEKELQNEATAQSKYSFVVNVPYALVKPEKIILKLADFYWK